MKFRDFFIPTSRNNFKAILLRTESIAVLTVLMFAFDAILGILPTTITNAELDMNSVAYLHNKERTQAGLNTLDLNSLLISSATNKADAMLESDCWDHYCPPGVSPWSFFNTVGYQYMHAGENLAEGFSDNTTLMRAWMNSPTHKANVLKTEYKEFGIGFATGTFQSQDNNTIAVVHFGTRMETPTPVPTQIITATPIPATPIPTKVATPVITVVPATPIPTPVITSTPVVTPLPTQTTTPTPVPTKAATQLVTLAPATPVPTNIEILTEERSPEETLSNITISYPEDKGKYIDPITEIKGIADPGIVKLELKINGQKFTTTTSQGGLYSFKSDEFSKLELGNGTYQISVEGYDINDNLISTSIDTIFTIELKEEAIVQSDLHVEEIIQKAEILGVVINYIPQGINAKTAYLYIDAARVISTISENGYNFETDKATIDKAEEIIIKVEATDGKNYELELDKDLLQNQIAKIMLNTNIPEESTSLETFLQLPSADYFKFDFSFLSLKGKANVLLLSFILTLFIVDYIVISKIAHMKDSRQTHNHHLSVGFIVILIIMSLLSTGVGSIAIGLTSG
jgi:uncharacterized protein YkwD